MHFLMIGAILLLYSNMAYAESNVPYYPKHEQLPFVIHICSFNNEPWVIKNLDSVFIQKYDNYRVIYIDDHSEDNTTHVVKAYLQKHNLWDKVTLIENEVRCRKMKNMYSSIRLCDDHEIIIQLDGDDWFCDEQLLARLNHIYQTQDVWLTYGSYIDYPMNVRGYANSTPNDWVEKKLFRKKKWLYMHPRSFYAWLFKAIKVQDHIAELVDQFQGLFFPSADDQASYWPMIEMAGKRFAYLPEISYVCNRGNPLSGRIFESPLQSACGGDARKRLRYQTLKEPCIDYESKFSQSTADILIFSNKNVIHVKNILNTLKQYVTGIHQIMVVSNEKNSIEHIELQKEFPNIKYIYCETSNVLDEIVHNLEQLTQDHILLAQDKVSVMNTLNITQYIQHLETTKAYGVYFAFEPKKEPFFNQAIGQSIIPSVHLYDNIYAWKFSCGKYTLFNNIDFTLLRKNDLLARLVQLKKDREIHTFESFYSIWHENIALDLHSIGLFCEKSPLQGSQTEIIVPLSLPECLHVQKKFSQISLKGKTSHYAPTQHIKENLSKFEDKKKSQIQGKIQSMYACMEKIKQKRNKP